MVETRAILTSPKTLRDLARADAQPIVGTTRLAEVLAGLRETFPQLVIGAVGDTDRQIAISGENLTIILSHLAANSAQHGATALNIDVDEALEGLRFIVRDNGPGISANNRTQVFDSFFTTRRTNGGTGMGLPIVRAMLTAHGGTIDLCDHEKGAAFELKFPIATKRHRAKDGALD